jgi:hypothetical protein
MSHSAKPRKRPWSWWGDFRPHGLHKRRKDDELVGRVVKFISAKSWRDRMRRFWREVEIEMAEPECPGSGWKLIFNIDDEVQ